MTGIHKVFKRFGNPIKIAFESENPRDQSLRYVVYWRPETFTADPTKLGKKLRGQDHMPLADLDVTWAFKFTESNWGRVCVICQDPENVEMHHVRKIKDMRKRADHDFFTAQMAAINRKQVPLCKKHHVALHKQMLTEVERKAFALGVKYYVRKS